jgi:Fe-S cluster assembly protein SufD
MRTNVNAATDLLDYYQEAFVQFEARAVGHDLQWLHDLRRSGFVRFYADGFPTTHDEDWRFTNVSAISQTPFRISRDGRHGIAAQQLQQFRMQNAACHLVFINGRFAPTLSTFDKLPQGVKVSSIAEEIRRGAVEVEQHIGRYGSHERDSFAALNTAFVEDGAYVHIQRGVVLDRPIHLVFVSLADSEPTIIQPRNLILAAEASQSEIVEEYVSLGDGVVFSNTVTELVAHESSIVSHCMIEREHTDAFNVSTLRIQQGRSSRVASHSLLLGGAVVRNNVHPVIDGEGAECLINGLFLGTGRQHMDNYMLVEHASPHGASRQFYNGILDQHAHGVFHGRIIVHKDAQRTDAKQTNRNLLLSDEAQIDTKPQLEIHADDVRCTHGATIGQIEDDALFYLRTRGLDETSARRLLLLAFAGECLDRMANASTRLHAENLVKLWMERFGGNSPQVKAS